MPGGRGGKWDYNFLRTELYLSGQDRDFHVRKGGMARLPGKKGRIAGSENPIVDPQLRTDKTTTDDHNN